MRENKTCPYLDWQRMPTEKLDQVLQAELAKSQPKEEVVLSILHELEEREKDIPVEKTPEVIEIISKLRKHEIPSKHSINQSRWIAGFAAAIAVFCLLVTAMPPTARAESIIDVLFRWTSSVFEFITPEQGTLNPPVDIIFETDNLGLQQLYDKIKKLGVTEPVIPMWLPEEAVLSELEEIPVPGGIKVFGKFENEECSVLLTYRVSTDISSKIEKEETDVEVFEAGEVKHFIMDNDENLSIVWTIDGVECSILTDVEREDVYKIIKSIYRRSLE